MKNKIEKVCNELNSLISTGVNFNDSKTRLFVKKYLELMLNYFINNELITDINVICDESNNPPEIVDIHYLIAQINWKENYQQYYLIFPFGTKESYDKLLNEII